MSSNAFRRRSRNTLSATRQRDRPAQLAAVREGAAV